MQDTIRKINVIQSRVSLPHMPFSIDYRRKRVAAYARVSTDSDEQLSSYDAQVDFYTRQITSNAEWEFVSVYTDEGISGTNMKKRDGFNQMIADAMEGKIDLILTKSISRFARNTVDTLTTVRQLKKKGVEVYFEKENIYTLDAKGEVLITIMSSLAQEESRSISENVTWGKKKSMGDGKICLPYKRFLGYEKGEDDLPKIVEEEAVIVRQIYSLFLEGRSYRNIAQYLTDQAIPTPSGKTKWSVSTVESILSNEKYRGDALLQKTFTVDFLNKISKKNEGEVQQYYIENSHPAIIDPKTFDLVQREMRNRQTVGRPHPSPFASKLICGECGGEYGLKVWHSTVKYRKQVWQCKRKYAERTFCRSPHVQDDEVKAAFIQAINQILGDKNQYIAHFQKMLPLLADTSALEKKLNDLQAEQDAANNRMRHYVEGNTREVQNQEEYGRSYRIMSEECRVLDGEIQKLQEELLNQNTRKEKLRRYLDELRRMDDLVTEFDENLWQSTVETAIVNSDKTLTFVFKDGTRVTTKATGAK